eukprot:4611725-Pleurochrysis_carterae.AAC.2
MPHRAGYTIAATGGSLREYAYSRLARARAGFGAKQAIGGKSATGATRRPLFPRETAKPIFSLTPCSCAPLHCTYMRWGHLPDSIRLLTKEPAAR